MVALFCDRSGAIQDTFGFPGTGQDPSFVGQSVSSYQVLRQLGTGAMDEVYLAEHRHLKRKAAVKLLASEPVGRPDLLERFFLEARATSAIAHPGIVQVFDCEIDPHGRPYLVMEYLEGEMLAALLARQGALPPPAAARYARNGRRAGGGARHRHRASRSKPENVFIVSHPADTTKIVDFGIAKLEGDFRAGQVHQTRSGALMGTPLYMSPEQCRDSANIDYRTDLYSLGCVLSETLTGRPPFTHATLGGVVVAHMTEPPRDLRESTEIPVTLPRQRLRRRVVTTMSLVRFRLAQIFPIACVITAAAFAGCMSSTVIQSQPPGAQVFLNNVPVGTTPYTMSDANIVGSTTLVRLEYPGYQPLTTFIARSEEVEPLALLTGIFLLVPLLWVMGYSPSHFYQLQPAAPGVAPDGWGGAPGAYPPPPSGYPPPQGAYPSPPQGAYPPPPQNGSPAPQQQQPAYPPGPAGYPPPAAGSPPPAGQPQQP